VVISESVPRVIAPAGKIGGTFALGFPGLCLPALQQCELVLSGHLVPVQPLFGSHFLRRPLGLLGASAEVGADPLRNSDQTRLARRSRFYVRAMAAGVLGDV